MARLTDAAPGKASLLQLQQRLEAHADHILGKQAKDVLIELQARIEPLRIRRDQMIAHYSLEQVTNKGAKQLPDVAYRDVNDCLGLVRQYMNLIAQHYHHVQEGYEHVVLQTDGDTLIMMLKWALRHRKYLLDQEIYVEQRDRWSDA